MAYIIPLLFTIISIIIWKKSFITKFSAIAVSLLVGASLLLLSIYYISHSLTGDGINESVLYHLNTSTKGAALVEFKSTIIAAIILIIISILSMVYTYLNSISKNKPKKNKSILFGAISISIALFLNPGLKDLYKLAKIIYVPSSTTKPEEYIIPDILSQNLNKKNILYIYLESLERTYLDEHLFPGLTPHLNQLEKEALSFSDIRQVYGTGWTIAGMVNSQCGIPLVTAPHAGNAMGRINSFLSGALCLGDILNKEGYQLQYVGGADLEFAGKGNFYKSHKFNEVYGLTELSPQLPDPNYISSWGLYDDSLFDIVENQYNKLSQKGQPFALFTLTLDTHHPTGHTPKSCSNMLYKDGKNPILNAVHCADQLIYNLVKKVQAHPKYDDTLIVISSDHLAMPNTAKELLDKGNRKNLLMFIGKDIKPQIIHEPGSLMDVTPTLLNLLNLNINGLGFGRNLFQDKSITYDDDFKNLAIKNRGYLLSLWNFPKLSNGIQFDIQQRLVKIEQSSIKYPALFILDENLEIKEIRFSDPVYSLTDHVAGLKYSDRFIWIDACTFMPFHENTQLSESGKYCINIGSLGYNNYKTSIINSDMTISSQDIKEAFSKKSTAHIADIHKERLKIVKKYGVTNLVDHSTTDITIPTRHEYLITSSGGYFRNSLIENIDYNTIDTLQTGISLLGINKENIEVIKHINTCTLSTEQIINKKYNFQQEIDHNSNFHTFMIIVHDSAICSNNDISPLFKNSVFTKWKNISVRTPYIGIYNYQQNKVYELLGKPESLINITINKY